ncbi:cation diffusion facilitator family transporter [Sphingomonas solaris]|uniref:Cation transporter n=1 Tax=Alterirhizorhabdus solaris TaxID=2529389 RepID=A0A558R864_9SPHN|nr:cation diffusion facilitator family transporter [Sphingomonas solaris]TVV75585.1 cation transporter [Sphingomonas solaris]
MSGGHRHGEGKDHAHDHGHASSGSHAGHGHAGHSHAPADFGRAFAIGITLNIGFVAIEAAAGLLVNSMALLADAGHNLSDVLGLVMAWGAYRLGRRPPNARFTYGLGSSTILAALANAVLLLVASGAILLEAVRRFADPPPVPGLPVMAIAAAGIVVNLGTALLFARGRQGDINIRGAYMHMAADAAVSAGVVGDGLLTLLTGLRWIDPATSVVIVVVIVAGTWGLLRESLALALHAVPPGIDAGEVTAALGRVPGVTGVHHVHIWATSTTATALTAHLVMPAGPPGDAFLRGIAHDLEERFAIGHATFQVERGGEADCGDCGEAG